MIGKIAVCSAGRLGIIEGQEELPWGLSWVGTGVFDGEPWASRYPRVLSARDAAQVSLAARRRSGEAPAVGGRAEV